MCLFGFHSTSSLLTSIRGINTLIVPYSSTVKLPHTKSEIVCVMQSIKKWVFTQTRLYSALFLHFHRIYLYSVWIDIGQLRVFIWSERGDTITWGVSVQWMDSRPCSRSLASGSENPALLLSAGLVPQQIHPTPFTGPLLANRNWQLHSAVCKAGSQALEFVVDLGRLICNHADGGSDFIVRGEALSHQYLIQRLLLVKLPQD